jgi:hypothetical protein
MRARRALDRRACRSCRGSDQGSRSRGTAGGSNLQYRRQEDQAIRDRRVAGAAGHQDVPGARRCVLAHIKESSSDFLSDRRALAGRRGRPERNQQQIGSTTGDSPARRLESAVHRRGRKRCRTRRGRGAVRPRAWNGIAGCDRRAVGCDGHAVGARGVGRGAVGRRGHPGIAPGDGSGSSALSPTRGGGQHYRERDERRDRILSLRQSGPTESR